MISKGHSIQVHGAMRYIDDSDEGFSDLDTGECGAGEDTSDECDHMDTDCGFCDDCGEYVQRYNEDNPNDDR